MKIFQLRAVIAVADCGNFSEAALTLDLSQPAISHAISTLEEELAVPLFVRGRHGALLTPAGERILYHARQALEHIQMMEHEANIHKGLRGGHVRIAAFRSVATHLLPKAFALWCLPEMVPYYEKLGFTSEIGVTLMFGKNKSNRRRDVTCNVSTTTHNFYE